MGKNEGTCTVSCIFFLTNNFMLCFLFFRDILKQSRSAMKDMKLDIHAKLFKNYRQVPEWLFQILLIGSIVLSLVMSFVWKEDVQLPWWGFLFSFGLAWLGLACYSPHWGHSSNNQPGHKMQFFLIC